MLDRTPPTGSQRARRWSKQSLQKSLANTILELSSVTEKYSVLRTGQRMYMCREMKQLAKHQDSMTTLQTTHKVALIARQLIRLILSSLDPSLHFA